MATYLRLFCAVMALAAGCGAPSAAKPGVKASIAPNGSIALQLAGRDLGTLEPALHEAVWRGASIAPARLGASVTPGDLRGQIRAPGGTVVNTRLRYNRIDDGLHLTYELTPTAPIRLNSLHVHLPMPVAMCAGGSYVVDGEAVPFPAQLGAVHLRSGEMRTLALRFALGAELEMRFARPTPVLVQDDRQWGPTMTVRIGPQLDGQTEWPAGRSLLIEFTLTAKGGMEVIEDGPVTIAAGREWLPLDVDLEIQAGSALDFSKLVPWHAPAGALGRVVARGPHFVFERQPNSPVRFYGFNLCFSAQYLSKEECDRLAERLQRMGYNAVRFHHHEGMLVDRSGGSSVKLNPRALDQLDYLFAALKRRGLYMTTDLYVSRPVFANEVWPGAPGDVGMDEFKMAVPVNERAWANFAAFTRALLDHVNPYTGMRWADDPALAWLSLINEGNPGNFQHLLTGRLREDWQRAWNAWLRKRYPSRAALEAAIGAAGDAAQGTVPLPERNDQSKAWQVYNVFLAENQRDLMERCRRFLTTELRCKALLTNMNAWTNPVQLQATRRSFDYVDDHFYVDHPEFLERPWQLPSRCPNVSPVAQGAPGGRHANFVRLLDKPFTLSEYNYSAPGRFRGVGGILTGAMAALQDWSVVWKFAYSHNRDNLFQPSPMNYFDMAADPLNLAADRASLMLFRRGDLSRAPNSVAIAMSEQELLRQPATTRSVAPGWDGLVWVTRVGTVAAERPNRTDAGKIVLPLSPGTAAQWGSNAIALDPYSAEAGERLLAEMRKRGWLGASNRTNLAESRFQAETGELTIDAQEDTLILDTAKTAGGYAEAGKTIQTAAATIKITETDATVWVSSVDGAPIRTSKRLLITHLTDLQNAGARYGDQARRVLMEWGGLPHLVLHGKAEVALRLAAPARATVWGLSQGGKRLEKVPTRVEGGALVVALDVDRGGKARMLYEVVVE